MVALRTLWSRRLGWVSLAIVTTLAIPAGANAHGQLGAGDVPRDPAAAETLMDDQAQALAELPRETIAGRCAATEPVAGLGDACRTDNGLFRVELDDGSTMETHGGDAPAVETLASPHLPESQSAVDAADVGDIECVTGMSDRRVELVYAYPSDRADRTATVSDPLRQELYRASAFVDAESRALDPSAGRKLRVLCSGGVPVVNTVALDPLGGASSTTFASIVSQLVTRGYPTVTSNSASPRRFMVFYDAESSGGAAGTGHFYDDDVPGTNNANNKGGRYAVEFAWSVSRAPHWDVMLHEMSHNMGAVSDNAPDSSGGGHCNDGLDIMCYSDGGTTTNYDDGVCVQERYDCGADSYFNPAPEPGTYLANNWNVAGTNNQWLQPYDAGWDDGGVPDVIAPTVPIGLVVTSVGHTTLGLSWGASTDDRSTVRYRAIVERSVAGSWVLDSTVQPINATSITITGLVSGSAHRIRLIALDQASNASGEAIVEGSTSSGPPVAPGGITSTVDPGGAGVTVTWPAGSAAGGVNGYEIEVQLNDGAWLAMGARTQLSARFTGLQSGTRYRFRVRTVGAGGTLSVWRTGSVFTTGGSLVSDGDQIAAPLPALRAKAATSVTIAWPATEGAVTWGIVVRDASARVVADRDGLTSSSVTIAGLRAGATYVASITAYGLDDTVGSGPGDLRFTTARDATAPTVVRLAGKQQRHGATVRIAWRPSTDASGIARYEIQRKIGTKWVKASSPGPAVRTVVLTGIKGTARPQLRIRAVDKAGNAGRWTISNR